MESTEIIQSVKPKLSLSDDDIQAVLDISNGESLEEQLATWLDVISRSPFKELVRDCRIEQGKVTVYVRHSWRFLNKRRIYCLDIAGFGVPAEQRGKGIFKTFFAFAAKHHRLDAIYVENVYNEQLANHLRRTGCHEIGDKSSPCFYRFKDYSRDIRNPRNLLVKVD